MKRAGRFVPRRHACGSSSLRVARSGPFRRRIAAYHERVSALGPAGEKELVVAEDGSIPTEQLESVGLRPGAHLRVVEASQPVDGSPDLVGLLPDLPDLDWEDFERGSELARRDLSGA